MIADCPESQSYEPHTKLDNKNIHIIIQNASRIKRKLNSFLKDYSQIQKTSSVSAKCQTANAFSFILDCIPELLQFGI